MVSSYNSPLRSKIGFLGVPNFVLGLVLKE